MDRSGAGRPDRLEPRSSVVVVIDFEDDGSVRSSVFSGVDAQSRANQHRARREAERLHALRRQAPGAGSPDSLPDRLEARLVRAA